MILTVASTVVLVYFVLMELQMLGLLAMSVRSLRRDRLIERHGRIDDLLSSDLTPPVSIIVPSYNEAAGIVESVRSMSMLRYPKFEIVVVNDGSSDGTLESMIEGFRMVEVTIPFRNEIETAPVRGIYRSTLPLSIIAVDKENGGKTDALNAGINVAKYPYVLLTDADVVMDGECVLRAMRHVVEDRPRTIAVGGNIRPINGSVVNRGRVVETHMPVGRLERMQILEYVRSFIGARPGWSRMNGLVLISGAFGIYRRDIMTEVGGFREGHLGEDMDLTMRLHKHMRDRKLEYRIVYAADAVCWTEVPTNRRILKKQRVRWHRGLSMVLRDFKHMLWNPKYGMLGMITWPSFFLFEYLAPIIEAIGWIILPISILSGDLNVAFALPLLVFAFFLGAINSLLGLYGDEAYGYFSSPLDALRLLALVFIENLGFRQQTVAWRIQALFMGNRPPEWGNMERQGVANV